MDGYVDTWWLDLLLIVSSDIYTMRTFNCQLIIIFKGKITLTRNQNNLMIRKATLGWLLSFWILLTCVTSWNLNFSNPRSVIF